MSEAAELVKRLRKEEHEWDASDMLATAALYREAADLISSQAEEIVRLKAALEAEHEYIIWRNSEGYK